MASLERGTFTKAIPFMIVGVIGLLIVETVSVYSGLTEPVDEVIFGVDDDIMRGVWAFLLAIFFALWTRRILQRKPDRGR